MNFYNDIDADVCAWIQGLIDEGLIPPGVVDQRSIADIQPSELSQYVQCHFFCGIAGWPLALQLAGWPPDRPVWTGSCPCQPFSVAGKGEGVNDPRHLWPTFRELIRQCRPPVVFGEQVASKDGREWLSGVFLDLEGMAYRRAGADLCAAGVGAPHIRQRLYWVADTACKQTVPSDQVGFYSESSGGCADSGLGHADHAGPQGYHRDGDDGDQPGRLGEIEAGSAREAGGTAGRVADTNGRHPGSEWQQCGGEQRQQPSHSGGGFWADSIAILCRDGKHRRIPTQPEIFPLADGLPYKLARRGSVRPALLKGAGNAIVPQVAAEFVRAFMDL